MRGQRVAHRRRGIRPLHATVKAFGVLAEDNDVDLRLFESAARLFANEIQRVTGKADARANAEVEIEALPHTHDRTEIGVALAAQFGLEFGVRLFFWFRGNGAEQPKLVFGQQVERAVGERVAFAPPEFPTDVSMDVVGFEPDSLEDAQRFGQHLVSNAVTRHGYNRRTRHKSSEICNLVICNL